MVKVQLHPFTFQAHLDNNEPIDNFLPLAIKAKLEELIFNLIKSKINEFNQKYGTKFKNEAAIARFAQATHYPYHKEVAKLDEWIVDVWAYARAYEKEVKEGKRKFDEEEFIENIPQLN